MGKTLKGRVVQAYVRSDRTVGSMCLRNNMQLLLICCHEARVIGFHFQVVSVRKAEAVLNNTF